MVPCHLHHWHDLHEDHQLYQSYLIGTLRIFSYAQTMATQNPYRYFKYDRKSQTRIAVWPNKLFGKSTLPSTDIKHPFLSTTFLMGVAPFGVQRLNSVPNLI
jgi:hypothetical protein